MKVHDGDIITVRLDGKDERVRQLYVDTPEIRDNTHGKEVPEGKAAAAYLARL